MDRNEHDARPRPLRYGQAPDREGAPWASQDTDLRRHAAVRRHRRALPALTAANGASFRAYVERFLVPKLKPGDIVAMDNLSSHKGRAFRQAICSAGARLLFTPSYSPDLHPIEQVFAKLKTLLRKANVRAKEAVQGAIAKLLDEYTPQGCANYLVNSGYGSI